MKRTDHDIEPAIDRAADALASRYSNWSWSRDRWREIAAFVFARSAYHDEDVCDVCGGENVRWQTRYFALWELATRGVLDGEKAILCPTCFITRLSDAGFAAVWEIQPVGGCRAVLESDADLLTTEPLWKRDNPAPSHP